MNLPGGDHYGLIAQDLEQVLPSLVKNSKLYTHLSNLGPKNEGTVSQNESGPKPMEISSTVTTAVEDDVIDFKAVNYTELIPILIKGMQEQQQQIQQQNQKIEGLKQVIVKLAPNFKIGNSGSLGKNVPNPVNDLTRIEYSIPSCSCALF